MLLCCSCFLVKLLIWGHGGGSLIGSPYDEITNDYLDLNELGQALSNIYTPKIKRATARITSQ